MPAEKRRDLRDGEEVEGVVGGITKLVEFCSKDINSQLSQSQVQVKLEPPEDGPIIALNGDSESGDDHYDSAGMNGDCVMETGAPPKVIAECRMRTNYGRRTMTGGQVELTAIAQ
ncbi:hypothetical protein OS493_027728 [Desmophyllum pertusum]|uniref:Uncharacterized protein n=1 Tax=Desmophyllum pertusum TaxID=174260 RepID=A0A9W9ZAA9_9CNID|nr:hypothetical protein OS493_027728 [Desmophyllum pertusum]